MAIEKITCPRILNALSPTSDIQTKDGDTEKREVLLKIPASGAENVFINFGYGSDKDRPFGIMCDYYEPSKRRCSLPSSDGKCIYSEWKMLLS